MEKVILSRPYSFEGKEYTELTLDLEALTGKDMIEAEKETRILLRDNPPLAETSKAYLAVLAAKAAKVPLDLIVGLPVKDFSSVTMTVQNFLFDYPSGLDGLGAN
jgi:hypothetical protein